MVFGIDDIIVGGIQAGSQAETNATNVAMQNAANQTNMNIAEMQTEANRQMAREAMGFEAGQARENRAFQERMSSSAYQRATADMRKAGINPMLAIGQGGASSPSGGMASGKAGTAVGSKVEAARIENSLGRGLASALETANLRNTLRQTESTTRLQEAQKEKTDADKKISENTAKVAALQVKAAQAKLPAQEAEARAEKAKHDTDATIYEYGGRWLEKLGPAAKYLQGLGGRHSAKGTASSPAPQRRRSYYIPNADLKKAELP